MSKWAKAKCSKQNGLVFVHCPQCKHEQEIPVGPGDYSIEPNGQVFPDFVCMNRPAGGQYCMYSGPLWIVNY